MSRDLSPTSKRPRISIDVHPDTRRRLRLAAAKKDTSVRQYVLDAIEARLKEDLRNMEDREGVLALTAHSDPVLAELWDNIKDAEYDRL